jgi:hypothetical protein
MVCWVVRDGPYKCMNMLLLWAPGACGMEPTAACQDFVIDKVMG